MSNNINLLKSSKTKRLNEEKRIRILRIISVLFLVVVGVVSAGLFFMQVNAPVTLVENEELSQKKSLNQLGDRAVKLFITQNRIKDIASIIDKRKILDTVLGDIARAIETNISITSLNLDGKNFSLTVVSSSLSSLDTLVTTLVGMAESKKIFSKVTLEGLSVDPKIGNYTLSLSGNLP